jgi:hypothetical protein
MALLCVRHRLRTDLLRVLVLVSGGVRVRSLREELVRFELTGARSHSVLCQVLRPLAAEPAAAAWRAMARVGAEAADAGLSAASSSSGSAVDRAHKVWSTLRTLRSPASLPAGTVLSLPAVADPRTFSPRQPCVLRRRRLQLLTIVVASDYYLQVHVGREAA